MNSQQPLQTVNATLSRNREQYQNQASLDENQQKPNRVATRPQQYTSGVLIDDYADSNDGSFNTYAVSKAANKQQTNRGRSNGLNELRKNLTQQKLWERQGDDPDQNNIHRSPIHLIQQKIQQSDVSDISHLYRLSYTILYIIYILYSISQSDTHIKLLVDIHYNGKRRYKSYFDYLCETMVLNRRDRKKYRK